MVRKLQTHRADSKRPEPAPEWLESDTFSEEEVETYQDAAHRCGLEVSHWARQMLNAAAREILDLDDPNTPRRGHR